MEEQGKRDLEDREKKAKANLKIMAKIAYKEWKEKKIEEGKQKQKRERLMRRNELMEAKYWNEQHPHKKGEVMLAYGVNFKRNLKDRPKSAKPIKAKKTKRGKKKQL